MTIEEISEYFLTHKWALTQGKGLLSKRLKATQENILIAKELTYQKLRGKNKAKILLFDVETAPMRAYVWSRWKQNIGLNQTISEWYMLCWSAKWLGSSTIISEKLTSEESINENDSRIVKALYKLVDEADIVIAYNGKRADIPWMNTRFIMNNLTPPSPYFVVDPFETAKKYFGFSSNKLDALAGYFGIEHKMETDFTLWDNAVRGDQKSIDYMSEYCGKDVEILEKVYLKLRPYIKNHPNLGNFENTVSPICSSCGSSNLELIENKYYYTTIGRYQMYKCKDCGAYVRGRVNLNITNKNIKVPVNH